MARRTTTHDQRWPVGPRPSSQRWIAEALAAHPEGLTPQQLIALRVAADQPRPTMGTVMQGLRRLRGYGFAGRRLSSHPPYYVWLLSPAGRDLLKKDTNGCQS